MQTILRREAYPNPYEALKALTRTGGHITEQTIKEFVEGLDVIDDIRPGDLILSITIVEE